MNTILIALSKVALPKLIRHMLALWAGWLMAHGFISDDTNLASLFVASIMFLMCLGWSYFTKAELPDDLRSPLHQLLEIILRNAQTAYVGWLATKGIHPDSLAADGLILAGMNYLQSVLTQQPDKTRAIKLGRNVLPLLVLPMLAFWSCIAGAQEQRAYGWKADKANLRALAYYHVQPEFKATVIKDEVDQRTVLPGAWNQGSLGSCTAYGNLAAFVRAYIGTNNVTPDGLSFLGLYYDERARDGTINEDAGSYISSGAWVLTNIGVGTAKTWPYVVEKFKIKPPSTYYKEAKSFRVIKAVKIDSSTVKARHLGIMTALSNDRVVVFGGIVNDSINSTRKDGFEPLPGGSIAGGHCRAIVGVSMQMTHRFSMFGKTYKGFYIVRNSWGPGWGDKGHSYVPVEVIEKLSRNDDFWTYIDTAPKPATVDSGGRFGIERALPVKR
jgi:hypothetical protein